MRTSDALLLFVADPATFAQVAFVVVALCIFAVLITVGVKRGNQAFLSKAAADHAQWQATGEYPGMIERVYPTERTLTQDSVAMQHLGYVMTSRQKTFSRFGSSILVQWRRDNQS